MYVRHLAACATLLACGEAVAQSAEELAERFGRLPALSMPRLSPDGRYLAILIPRDGIYALATVDFGEGERQRWLATTTPDGFKFSDCQWAKSDRLICIVDYTDMRGRQPYYEFAVYSFAADGSDAREMLRQEPYLRLLNRLAHDPFNIAIEKATPNGWPAVHFLNVYTGDTRRLVPAKPPALRWELTDDGETAVGFGIPGVGRAIEFETPELWVWRRQTGEFTRIAPGLRADLYSDLVGLDRDKRFALLLGDDGGRQALLAAPLDGQPVRTLLRDDTYDLASFDALPGLSHRLGRATIVTGVEEHLWLEPNMADSQRQLDSMIPGARATVEAMTHDLDRSVVRFEGDRVAPRYVFFAAGERSRPLGSLYPNVDDAALAAVRVARVSMRDGVDIDVFVTEPQTRAAGPRKAVVLPHGGPEARDYRRFDYLAQFLAASGYAVLQPNFRGSRGYGRQFLEAGRRGWGTAMHDDITDTARWAIAEGLAEPDRVCIVGISYGGYAALLGVAKEPDLYACAISIAGPSDLGDLLFDFGKGVGPGGLGLERNRIGFDRAELAAQSPLRLAADITAPVLLIHGRRDSRVEADQSERMARELRRRGKSVELILHPNGDHGLSDEEQRIDSLRAVARFLAAHL